ncbi:MAG: PEP-CTERM sorting domain-containing protein [Planctomycetia bacterium]|nr:PEP-CTERM sorting domain-containing protein [Planctomycetia bacterium]
MMLSSKKLLAAVMVSLLGASFTLNAADAGIIFRVTQTSPVGTITLPQPATFAVTLESDSGSQVITGVDFTVKPGGTAGQGGIITGGTNLLFAQGGFFGSDFPPQGTGLSVDYSTFSFTGATLTSTPTQIATFTLATSGTAVVAGTYSMALSGLVVLDQAFGEISPVSAVPATYTVAPVPEPSTLVMAGLACGVGLFKLRRGRGQRATSGSRS